MPYLPELEFYMRFAMFPSGVLTN